MSVHYGFIAKDSDMIVFEILVNKEMNPRQVKAAVIEVVVVKEEENKDVIQRMNTSNSKSDTENPDMVEQFCEPLKSITGGVELNLLLQSGIFFGIVTELNYGEGKAKRFL
jgi:hypothetical protein